MAELEAAPPLTLRYGEVITEKRLRIAAICVALFAFTFAVYWLMGPQETPYSHQTNQANNILHGHMDMVPEYSRNFNTLERVLYDGQGFCFKPGDPEAEKVTNPRFSPDCKIYMQHSFGPAFIVLPGVAIWGNELNQTLVSVIFAAMLAPIVFLISARFTSKLTNQLLFTAFMMFGTIFWWIGSNGGVWFFAQTTATFFLFAAIYWTVARPNPLLAGLLLGAAYLCRPTIAATGLFFVIALAPLWLKKPEDNNGRWGLNFEPIIGFAAGLAPFVALGGLVNYLRFDSPTENGYGYTEQLYQDYLSFVWTHGLFDSPSNVITDFHESYVRRHPLVMLEAMPVFTKSDTDAGNGLTWAPVAFSGGGLAIWVTTPAFVMALFQGVDKRVSRALAVLVTLGLGFVLFRALSRLWESDFQTEKLPYGIQFLPIWIALAVAIGFSLKNRDRLTMACWAAVIPTALLIFTFAATGWSQWGYRYGLDFTPFLWLLVVRHIGDNLKWWHVLLIAAGIAVNLAGVLWYYHFQPDQMNDWVWFTL
jgi:hypothetical protein